VNFILVDTGIPRARFQRCKRAVVTRGQTRRIVRVFLFWKIEESGGQM